MNERELPGMGIGNRVPRNAPCPCGSGKKYKRCCLPKEVRRDLASIERDLEADLVRPDRFEDPELDAWKQADRAVVQKLCEATAKAYPDGDTLFEMYLPPRLAENLAKFSLQNQAMGDLFDWAGLDYRPQQGARTVAERMLERPGGLAEKEWRVLANMAAAARSVWQVVRIEKDKGVEAEDLLRGGRVFLNDVSLSRTTPQWAICLFRVYPAGPFHFLTCGWATIPPGLKDKAVAFFKRYLAAYRRKHPEASWDEFLRSRADLFPRMVDELGVYEDRPAPRLANTNGDELVFCEAEFSAEDADAALTVLDGKERFEVSDQDGEREAIRYGSGSQPGSMGRTLEAVVKVAGGKLVLECNSRKRLAAAKKVLLSIPGIKHLKDSFRAVEDVLAERPFPRPPDHEEPLPKELEEVTRKFNEQYYEEHWVRDHIPALGGKTPLELVKSAQGRRRVEQLIREMEFSGRERGHDSHVSGKYDFNRLRRVLGLAEE